MSRANDILQECALISDRKDRIRAVLKSAWEIRRSYPRDTLELSLSARQMSQAENFEEGIAHSFLNSGAAYYLLSQYHHSLIDLEKAQAFFETSGDHEAMGSTLRNIGNVYHSMDLLEPSIECYKKALAIAEKENNTQTMAYNLGNIGYVYHKMGRFDDAKAFFLDSSILLEQINDELANSDLMNNLGNVYLDEGNLAQGILLIRESLRLAESLHHIRGMATARKNLGMGLIRSVDYKGAITELEAGLKLAEEMGELILVADILQQLSEAHEKNGDFKTALHVHKAYELRKEELQEISKEVLLDAFRLKSEAEKSFLEKEHYKKENAELEKARKEIELKNKELERLSIVASETENTILILEPNGILEWVNPSFERLNACTLDEFKKKYGNTIYEVSNNPDIRAIVERCISSRSSVHYESANELANGLTVWESSTMTPIFDEKGELAKIIIIDADATERKLNEEIIRQKNKDITDSINYARHLQEAILPPPDSISTVFPESFILSIPKDIVSGDFYWFSTTAEVGLLAAADCTGHGVPGAFMSVIGNELLNITLHDPSIRNPAQALTMLDTKVRQVFRKGRQETLAQDGMDIALLIWHFKDNTIQFSGAKRPLVLIRNKKVHEFAANRFSIGGKDEGEPKQFTDETFTAQKGDMFYLFSDGFPDQFGGAHGKKFMFKEFVKLLTRVSAMNAVEQKKEIEKVFYEYKGNLDQVDDVLIIGIRIP
ncbi:MAG TPA: tetratricopeptide repeat protein [Bacteroidia bacterium]|jgi:PAS domain S-box-containing protein|nr:tetratricopeptide repeat protein [Bacteroidia bacterium]